MSLETIKRIRTLTGAGIVDVQKALAEAGNDEEKAIAILRQQGQKMAAKRIDRQTSEGVIALARNDSAIAVACLTCETDFVARNADFIAAAEAFAQQALDQGAEAAKVAVEAQIQNELILKIGENIQLASLDVIKGSVIGSYLHSNKKLAAIVVLKNGPLEIANDVAMQVTAMRPDYLRPEDVPADIIAKESEIYHQQLLNEGKPAEMIEKILPGKLQKFYSEVCLLKQPFVKDDKQTIENVLAAAGAEIDSFKFFGL